VEKVLPWRGVAASLSRNESTKSDLWSVHASVSAFSLLSSHFPHVPLRLPPDFGFGKKLVTAFSLTSAASAGSSGDDGNDQMKREREKTAAEREKNG